MTETPPFSFDARKFPTTPGVYLMKGTDDKVLYVGKAINLRNRLRSYFSTTGDGRAHIRFLLSRIRDIEVIVTDTDKEALILENTLIKKYRPRYNINLRDDKTYVSLRIDLREEFPGLQITRKVKKDGARYFGPYASSAAVRQTLKEIYRIFPLRHYPLQRCRKRGRPCLFHQIGQCSAPCHGLIDKEAYQRLVDGVIALLSGRESEVIAELKQRMQVASTALRFEEAARLRDQIRAIEATVERQKVVSTADRDQDVFGLHRDGGEVEVSILFIRRGKLTGHRSYNLEWRLDENELLASFLQEFYRRDLLIPDQILLPFLPETHQGISEWLREMRGRRVELLAPQRGVNREMVLMANRNAEESRRERGRRHENRLRLLETLQQRLQLRHLPRRIECFDISNFQGRQSVGSMAVIIDAEPAPQQYRRFRIRTIIGSDDFASLAEVLQRRLSRGRKDDDLPDCLLIDGGKGQLGRVREVVRTLGLEERLDLIGMAKSRVMANVRGKVVERSEERFFRPGRKNPVILRQGSAELFLLQRLRDEAHRFAIEYHRKLRGRASLHSRLEEIPGIGPARRKLLLKHFGSLKKIRSAGLAELEAVPGLPKELAARILKTLQEPREP
ncbi:excinuclease ABC subunit C [Geothermobacter hydrogeniphilus]|uniref:UvrABC system protein C n=1 Tax=Geothermobacter hydrogeniphilus TaxID=1969733 RepID=A0A2K2HDT9_9BACT|nr:excinuclease ABC subunit UvrC [Geothermobacter hydrogeniphilus]PNU21419.1 excinuclease ABC subunit C [Geothermobacter hydrogeniphilus]